MINQDASEADHHANIDDLVTRYLAGESDGRRLTAWVAISRLSDPWTFGPAETARALVAHHLFMFDHGSWPEDDLRTSLAQLQDSADLSANRGATAMFVKLLRAGHIPPGTRHTQVQDPKEALAKMTPEELVALGNGRKRGGPRG